jgi:hypothetical protein
MIYDFLKRYAAKRRKKYVDYANIRRFQIKKVWFFPLGTMVICSTYMFWEKTRCFSCAFRPWPIPPWRCLRPAAPPPRGGGDSSRSAPPPHPWHAPPRIPRRWLTWGTFPSPAPRPPPPHGAPPHTAATAASQGTSTRYGGRRLPTLLPSGIFPAFSHRRCWAFLSIPG